MDCRLHRETISEVWLALICAVKAVRMTVLFYKQWHFYINNCSGIVVKCKIGNWGDGWNYLCGCPSIFFFFFYRFHACKIEKKVKRMKGMKNCVFVSTHRSSVWIQVMKPKHRHVFRPSIAKDVSDLPRLLLRLAVGGDIFIAMQHNGWD